MARLGGAVMPWDNQIFATLGDVHRTLMPIIEFPQDAFHQTNIVVVPMDQGMKDMLTQDPVIPFVGPFAAGTADTQAICTPNLMY